MNIIHLYDVRPVYSYRWVARCSCQWESRPMTAEGAENAGLRHVQAESQKRRAGEEK